MCALAAGINKLETFKFLLSKISEQTIYLTDNLADCHITTVRVKENATLLLYLTYHDTNETFSPLFILLLVNCYADYLIYIPIPLGIL